MKILVDGSVFALPCSGIAKATVGLYKALMVLEPNMSISIVGRRFTCDQMGDLCHTAFFGMLPTRMWRLKAFPIYMAYMRPDIVHFPWNGKIPRIRTTAIIVSTIHDVLPLQIPGFFRDSDARKKYFNETQYSISRSDIVLTDSEYSKKEITKNFQFEREVNVLPLAVRLPVAEESVNQLNFEYFLYVGGYDARKGLELLLRIFLKLHSLKRLHSRLILAGTRLPVSPEFELLLNEGKAKGIVREVGFVSEQRLYGYYRSALALTYLSKYEGFGLPPLEAMSVGCPVMTTSGTSLPEVCGDAAFYVDPENEESIAKGLIELETKPELRQKLRLSGTVQAAKFSWENTAARYREIIDEFTQNERDSRYIRRSIHPA